MLLKLFFDQEKDKTAGKGQNAVFTFSHNVFKRLLPRSLHKWGLDGKISNPLPNNKVLDLSKLKAFADDKISVNEK